MGVTGLTGFIASNSKLFTVDFELKNTRIIIDGSTLLRVLFVKSKQDQLNCQFGGNYVYYAKVVASFFKKLQWNNVRPYVVFQGSQNTNITEDSTVIKDKSQAAKLRKLAYCSKHFAEHDYRALHVDFNCLLADKAMMSVLSELNIPHIRVVLFSDEIVGSLATKLKCPVFSDDSNFYLCDLEEGFINGNLFEYDADCREAPTDAITCKLYQRSKFLSLFELKDEVLPVMSAILGNNFRKRGTYTPDPFVSLIERLPFDSAVIVDDLITESLTMKRISHLVYWLRGHTSDSAGREFLEYLDDEHGEEEGLVLGHRLFDDYIKTEAKAEFTLSGYEEEDIECHWKHLNGSSCSQSHARLDETEDDVLHIEFSDLFGRRFLQEAWMKDLVDFRTLHVIRTVLIVDDYSKPCPLKYSEQLCPMVISASKRLRDR
ncbi:Protein asteroid -like protein 1 [Halotydeus destructor]|nr:Protein asteroid -like protein 1 [Halotydeus destructor]